MDRSLEWILLVTMLVTAGLLTLWMAGAIYFDVCRGTKWGRLLAPGWAIGVVAMFAAWQPLWQPFAGLLASAAMSLGWWFLQKPAPPAKKPGIMQTLLRSLLVQNHNLNDIGVRPADVVVEPDVTGFDLTEFMLARELAAIGEAAALEQIPHIQRLLTRLDPQLFRAPS